MKPTRSTFSAYVLVRPGCTAFVPLGVADMFRKAASLSLDATTALDVSLVSTGTGRSVECAGGVYVECDRTLREARRADMIFVPPVDPGPFDQPDPRAERYVRDAHKAGALVASACTGTFFVARAGILDGLRATTHWAFHPLFAKTFPNVHLDQRAIIVDQGRVITAAGATAFVTLVPYLLERILGVNVARTASRLFLIDVNKAPQSSYAMFDTDWKHADEAVRDAQKRMEEDPSLGVADIARAIGMSSRNLARRFSDAIGTPPRSYLARVRVEAAKRLLIDSRKTVQEIGSALGYADVAAFRRLFSTLVGVSPLEYRAQFGKRRAPATVVVRGASASGPRPARRR